MTTPRFHIKAKALNILQEKVTGRASDAQIARAVSLVENGKVRWLDKAQTMVECQSQRKMHAPYTLYRGKPELHQCEAVEHGKLCVHRIAAMLLLIISTPAPTPEPTYEDKQLDKAYEQHIAEGGELAFDSWRELFVEWQEIQAKYEADKAGWTATDEATANRLEEMLCL